MYTKKAESIVHNKTLGFGYMREQQKNFEKISKK